MITVQDAYCRGLDDSEAITIRILTQLINNEQLDTYNNPKLETLKNALKVQLDYVYSIANNPKSNLAKYAKKALENGKDLIDSQ